MSKFLSVEFNACFYEWITILIHRVRMILNPTLKKLKNNILPTPKMLFLVSAMS